MKKITLLISTFVLVATTAFAQSNQGRNCGTTEAMEALRAQDPVAFDANKILQEQITQDWIANEYDSRPEAVITIPVVVQIWYNTATVPDSRVTEQLATLNEDFRKMNSDASSIPSVFAGVTADCEIEFCLVNKDPQGNPTTGIIRKTNSIPPQSGGTDMWDPSKYLNIYVYAIGGGILGFTYMPSGTVNQAVHVDKDVFGDTGGQYGAGRTATHEIGHWLDLDHIWGGGCGSDDGVSDTPDQSSNNFNCPTHPSPTCNNGGDMFMNYMDYVDDLCMYAYTKGQKARMISAINTYRPGLLTSTACGPVSTVNDDAGISSITTPTGSLCSGTITPVVILRNFGQNALTAVTINYSVDGTAQAPYSWTGNLAPSATVNVTLPGITAAAGAHTFDANTSQPNGTTDQLPSNDGATQTSFTVIGGGGGVNLPFSEGFEGTYLPTGWTANNDDSGVTWAKTTVAAKTGTASAYVDNSTYDAKGAMDDIITPILNLSSVSAPVLTFELAYKLWTSPTDPTPFSDTLEVLVSTDCGATWNSVYRKSSSALVTTTPTFQASTWVPTANDWRKETVDISAYASSTGAMIMFRNISDYENSLHIDDINISGTTGIDNTSFSSTINIYPNPTSAIINVLVASTENTEIVVLNVVGEVVYNNNHVLNVNKIDMSNQANGVYFVKVKSGNQVTTKKVILAK